MLTRNFSN